MKGETEMPPEPFDDLRVLVGSVVVEHDMDLLGCGHLGLNGAEEADEFLGAGRVARPFGFALTDPGMRLSRTRLFPRVTRVMPRSSSRGG